MLYILVLVLATFAVVANAGNLRSAGNSSVGLGMCGYEATCNAGGYGGVCVSIGSGCCGGGTVTSGLCPGIFMCFYFFVWL